MRDTSTMEIGTITDAPDGKPQIARAQTRQLGNSEFAGLMMRKRGVPWSPVRKSHAFCESCSALLIGSASDLRVCEDCARRL